MKSRFPWQIDLFQKTKDLHHFAFEMEVRLGKTLPAIDTAIHNYEEGRINAVLVVAPNTVDLNWSQVHLPEYLDDLIHGEFPDLNKNSIKVMQDAKIFEWSKSKSKKFDVECQEALNYPGLVWFCFNLEGIADRLNKHKRIVSSRMQEFIEAILAQRKVFLIDDEAHKFAKPDSKCTVAMLRLSKGAVMVRNLTGTPITDKPLDVWSQYGLMDPCIIHDEQNDPMRWTTFKSTFAFWKHPGFGVESPYARVLDTERGDKGYKDLDKLYGMIDPHRFRMTQKEAYELDPVKFAYFKEPVFEKHVFEMPPNHQKVYDQIRDEMMAQLDSGEIVTAEQKLANMLRLQQISRGYVGGIMDEEKKKIVDLGPPYPAVEAIIDYAEEVEGKIIVWCTFTPDVELILRVLGEKGYKCARYDGKVDVQDRMDTRKAMWEDPELRFVVGNPGAGGLGVDMAFAATMINYSFNYRMDIRLQAIGRFQGPKQKAPLLLHVDMVCAGTNDLVVLQALAGKRDLSDILTGDKNRFKKFLMGEKV